LYLYQITDDTESGGKNDYAVSMQISFEPFCQDLFVIRLKHAPTESAILAMNEDFADIIIGAPIRRIDPTPTNWKTKIPWTCRGSASVSIAGTMGVCANS